MSANCTAWSELSLGTNLTHPPSFEPFLIYILIQSWPPIEVFHRNIVYGPCESSPEQLSMSEPRALMCFHPEFPDRAYSVIIHDYLSSGDLSRVDCSLDEPRRQHFQRLMRGMPWKFIRDNANLGLSLVGWMRDRGVILPEGLEDSLALILSKSRSTILLHNIFIS